jgi:hypothetical protein
MGGVAHSLGQWIPRLSQPSKNVSGHRTDFSLPRISEHIIKHQEIMGPNSYISLPLRSGVRTVELTIQESTQLAMVQVRSVHILLALMQLGFQVQAVALTIQGVTQLAMVQVRSIQILLAVM